MSTTLAQREQAIQGKIASVGKRISELEQQASKLTAELESHSGQRQQYHLLNEICTSLDKLTEMGAADLFWGQEAANYDPTLQLQRARKQISDFEFKISAIEQSRSDLQDLIRKESVSFALLEDELAELKAEAEEVRNEYVLVRQISDIPFRPTLMPWTTDQEDKRRFRKILLIAFFLSLLIGVILPLFRKPVSRYKDVVIPENLAQIIKRKQEELKPVEQKQENLAERKDSSLPSKDSKVASPEAQKARAVAVTKGVLAFKNNFSDLIDDAPSGKMGAQAHLSNAGSGPGPGNGGKYAPGEASVRSLITSQATGGSGGINTAGLSRLGSGSGGGGAGQSITGAGVKFARVESATGAGVADDRPLSKGAGPSRTDEEIQIVFDRYKATLYRIYNRELRNDPTLRGKMVLRITIEPDGRVSACSVKSTDMNSQVLSTDIVSRVLSFNFGAKAGVPKLTILYPIDFLPAT